MKNKLGEFLVAAVMSSCAACSTMRPMVEKASGNSYTVDCESPSSWAYHTARASGRLLTASLPAMTDTFVPKFKDWQAGIDDVGGTILACFIDVAIHTSPIAIIEVPMALACVCRTGE